MPVNPGAVSAIPVEVFSSYIVEKLRKSNPHLACATSEDSNVLAGSVVHIPQAGASPNVVKNRKNLPATAVQRGDSFVTYTLDVFTTDPVVVTWHEENEISYAKTDSVLNDHTETLVESVGDNMFYNWVHGLKMGVDGAYAPAVLPAANILTTSGASEAANAEDGQTGNRLAFSYKDLQRAQAKMNKAGVAKENRFACIESYQYQQFIDSLSANQMAAFQASADLANGIVGKFAGFNIQERASVLAYTAAGALIVPGAALAADSDLASLCWQQSSVGIAKGDITPFQNMNDALYYGDIFSALVKFGGRCRREDWKGVIAIKQGKPA
jgi:hypothetical protein